MSGEKPSIREKRELMVGELRAHGFSGERAQKMARNLALRAAGIKPPEWRGPGDIKDRR